MAVAKLLGFDLCSRLYSLRDRHLHLPRRFEVPAAITDIVQQDVSLDPIRESCDRRLRLVAIIAQGSRTATDVPERFGSTARADRIYRAGHALGQLLRTVYLCDYFTLPEFRRSLYQVLERGESVYALHRQICTQALPAKRGRRAEELIGTSGALTLVTNCVMAWNAQGLQRAVDREGHVLEPAPRSLGNRSGADPDPRGVRAGMPLAAYPVVWGDPDSHVKYMSWPKCSPRRSVTTWRSSASSIPRSWTRYDWQRMQIDQRSNIEDHHEEPHQSRCPVRVAVARRIGVRRRGGGGSAVWPDG